ncbi:MAG: sulfatase-like hydrolase/transferase [Lentisphaeraceae bacterium]|nr:sulfatase-like hydrolase/transferase [Lentisphaeraceae bacterium]
MYRTFLFSMTFLSFLTAQEKPNILFIYTDDQSHRTVGCYEDAYDWVKTPNIDSLAKSGVRFNSAYIGTWCMPSRLTMLTGLLQHGMNSVKMTGEYPASTYNSEKLPFWPKTFKESGYYTAHIGKWHTGIDAGYGRDWDHQIVWNRPKYTKNAFSYYYDQEIEIDGQHIGNVGGYSTDNYTKWAESFIRGSKRDKSKPWALWLCYAGTHGPFTPADRHKQTYKGVDIPTPADVFPPRPDKPAHVKDRNTWVADNKGTPVLNAKGKGIHGNTLHDWTRQYHQAVLSIDEGVGKVVKALRESGQYDNTLIIFTSDQGFAWGQHGFKLKVAPYDANIKAPLIISYPKKMVQNKVVSSHVSGADITPTLFDAADIRAPWRMDGHSLMPLLEDQTSEWNHPILMTYTMFYYGEDTKRVPTDPAKLYHKSGVPWWSSLTKGRYKYIQTLVEGEIPELYDLQNDPEELTNLALDNSYKDIIENYRQEMIKELKRTKASFADQLPSTSE